MQLHREYSLAEQSAQCVAPIGLSLFEKNAVSSVVRRGSFPCLTGADNNLGNALGYFKSQAARKWLFVDMGVM